MCKGGRTLFYSEKFADKHDAAKREREIKGWRREKKLARTKGRDPRCVM